MAVGQQRDVGHHFVIDKLVALGGLHHAVQRHHAAKGGVFEDYQILMIGFLMIEHVIHGKILTKLVMQRFLPYRFSVMGSTSFVNIHYIRQMGAHNTAVRRLAGQQGASGRLLHVGEQAE